MRIVALHGQLGMASDWDAHAIELTKLGHQLDAVDMWQYLESGEISLLEFGEKLNQGKDDGQIIIGYSMGGRLALHSLINQPKKWKAAVIISAHLGLPEEERRSRRRVDDEWASKVVTLPWSEFLNEWNKQGVLSNGVMPGRSALEVRKKVISRSFRCWSLAEHDNLLNKLAILEIPILWVVGENDEKFCNQAELAVSMLKNAKLLKIANTGHRVPWEAKEELINVLDQLIRDVL
jgi:2-succinyl-6-hydroxy-2,4-cyclohexadiene-1-carboxylate synthase